LTLAFRRRLYAERMVSSIQTVPHFQAGEVLVVRMNFRIFS